MEVYNGVINGVTWSLGENMYILMFKQAPKPGKHSFYQFSLALLHEFFVCRITKKYLPKFFMSVIYNQINSAVYPERTTCTF